MALYPNDWDINVPLAIAYAEIGDFEAAQKEISTLNQKGILPEAQNTIQELVKLFRAHKPYRRDF